MSTSTARQPTYAECDRILCRPGSIFEMEEMEVHGTPQLVWKNAPRTFRDFFVDVFARFAPRVLVSEPVPEPAAFYDRRFVTYAEVWARSVKFAAILRDQGIGAGGRVAIGGGNSSSWMAAFIGITLLGAVPVLLNSKLQLDAQLHCLTLTKPEIVLLDGELAEVLASHTAQLASKGVGRMFCWHSAALSADARAKVKDLASITPSDRAVADVQNGAGMKAVHPESDGVIMFTSGTTNMPKGVLVTQRGCLSHTIAGSIPAARAILRAGGSFEDALLVHTPPAEQGAMLVGIPLFHVTGCMAWMMRGLHMGMKIVFMRRWSVPDAVKLLVDEKIGVIGGVPAIATAIIQSPLLPKEHIIEAATYGGAAAPKRLAADILGRWPNAVPTHAYGMTETAGLHNALTGADYAATPDSVGPAMPVAQVRIVDPDTGAPLPPNVMGMVQCRGPNIMKCYVDNPKATQETLQPDGWLTTGDLGSMDENGYLFIRDRAKDVIIRGGENIASAEVENAIYQDDRVAEAAAVPVPDDVLGERVGVAVSLAPGASATPESIIAAAAPRLRHPARPAIVLIVDALPRNANAKIVKTEIKKAVVAHWEKQGRSAPMPEAKL